MNRRALGVSLIVVPLAFIASTASGASKPGRMIIPDRSGATESSRRMDEAPALVIARSKQDLALKTGVAERLYQINDANTRWEVDLNAGTIAFVGSKITATAPVQVIGTYNSADRSWLWGWDHPSVPPPAAFAANTKKAYGERHALKTYTTRKIVCSQPDAWQFAAVASYLTGAQGAYRGVSGTTFVFMTFGTVTLKKAP